MNVDPHRYLGPRPCALCSGPPAARLPLLPAPDVLGNRSPIPVQLLSSALEKWSPRDCHYHTRVLSVSGSGVGEILYLRASCGATSLEWGGPLPYPRPRQVHMYPRMHHPDAPGSGGHGGSSSWWDGKSSGARSTRVSGSRQPRTWPKEAGLHPSQASSHRHMLHCPIGFHLQNADSKVKLWRILRQRLQCLKRQAQDLSERESPYWSRAHGTSLGM